MGESANAQRVVQQPPSLTALLLVFVSSGRFQRHAWDLTVGYQTNSSTSLDPALAPVNRDALRPAPDLDVCDAPDQQRDRPGGDEQGDDQVADSVDVDPGDPAPEEAPESELVGRESHQLDGTD